ncbi:hypothetical protein [Amycolatopsis kentuckyensis]|uniref:hypothetical protein n=1 Tax=Amycolatopsis kentuckyensis TaxID=218823 RepID=UPI00142D5C4F|nr:hypothetical protein [Amycolatopsis kentuckyensis]
MADSNALRTRRSRLHSAGDHSLCKPGRCPAVLVSPPPAVAPRCDEADPETGLGPRGQRLWTAVTTAWTPTPLHRELLLEACRVADRLEQLDRQLRGEDWLRFWRRNDVQDEENRDDPLEIHVFIDKALAEAREQGNALRQMITELAKVAVAPEKPAEKGGGVLAGLADELAAKRRALPAG